MSDMRKFYCPKCESYKDEAICMADAQVRFPSSCQEEVEMTDLLKVVGYECMDCGSIDVEKSDEFGAGEEVEGMTLMEHVNA